MSRAAVMERLFENSRTIQQIWKRFFYQIVKQEQLSIPQMEVLFLLHAHKSMSGSDLATAVQVSRSAITQLIDGLVNRGYVERQDDKQDRRMVHLSLSVQGVETMQRLDAHRLQHLKTLTATLTETQLEAMTAIQDSMIAQATNQQKEEDAHA